MCGLIGMIAKKQCGFFAKDAEMFQQMLYADALRGWDATGVFGVNKYGNVDVKKQATAAGHFVGTPQYKAFHSKIISDYQFVIGHNRKATHGEKRHIDAHPFWDKSENVCLVHNGMIRNHKDFCAVSTVDSAAIAEALGEAVEPADVISKVDGAFAFIWYDVEQKQLKFIRNDLRPLHIVETDTCYFLASEQSMVFWICHRNNIKIVSMEEVKERVLYTISLDDRKVIEGDKVEQEKKLIPATVTYIPFTTSNGSTSNPAGQNDPWDGPDSLYYTDAEIYDADSCMQLLKHRDKIYVRVDTYDALKHDTTSYILHCTILNCEKAVGISVVNYISAAKFEALDISDTLEVTISNLIRKDDEVTIYTHSPRALDSMETLSGLVVSDALWFDEYFPNNCTVCNKLFKWKELPDCVVDIEAGVATALCPTCSGVYPHESSCNSTLQNGE